MQDSALRRTEVATPSPLGRPVAMALGGDRLVAVDEGGAIAIVALASPGRDQVLDRRVDRPGGRIALSADGVHLLVESPRRDAIEVWNLPSGRPVAGFGPLSRGEGSVAAALLSRGGRDVLVVSPRRYVLEAYVLGYGLVPAFAVDLESPRAFEVEYLVPAGNGDDVLAIGHYFSEGRESLLDFSFQAAARRPESAVAVTVERGPFDDYAYRLAAGPCGTGEIVVYRDPEDDEDPDEDDPPEEMGELQAFRGLYVRRLDGRLVERIDYDGQVATGDPVVATRTVVAIALRDRVEFVPRTWPGVAPISVPAAVSALDPGSARAAACGADGRVELLELITA